MSAEAKLGSTQWREAKWKGREAEEEGGCEEE